MKVTLEELKSLHTQDKVNKHLTYIVPLPNFKKGFIRDELMWVESVGEKDFIVFRCMDGKRHQFSEEDLEKLKLVGRPN